MATTRRNVALACRILAFQGLAEDILGHVSARVDGDRILIRCRGPRERGLLFTQPADIRLIDLSSDQRSDGKYSVPNEFPIHTELLRAHPEINAVVHAHPPAIVAADLAGIPLVPMIGAFNIPAALMAAAGIPVFGRSVLIQTQELAHDMVDAMRGREICVLRGHGITTAGGTVQQAVARPQPRLARADGLPHRRGRCRPREHPIARPRGPPGSGRRVQRRCPLASPCRPPRARGTRAERLE